MKNKRCKLILKILKNRNISLRTKLNTIRYIRKIVHIDSMELANNEINKKTGQSFSFCILIDEEKHFSLLFNIIDNNIEIEYGKYKRAIKYATEKDPFWNFGWKCIQHNISCIDVCIVSVEEVNNAINEFFESDGHKLHTVNHKWEIK